MPDLPPEYEDHVRREVVPKIDSSAAFLSLWDGHTDVKLAVELGFAVLLDKPIVVIALHGARIPPALRRLAHAVIETDDMDDPAFREQLRAAVAPFT